MTETIPETKIETSNGQGVHHIPLRANLNSKVGYCGYKSKTSGFRAAPWKPICSTCELLWEVDGQPGSKGGIK